MNMNKENLPEINNNQVDSDKDQKQTRLGVGIIGDSTNNDIVMTKLWVSNDKVDNIEINLIGASFSETRAKKIEAQLRNKSLENIEIILDYHFNRSLKQVEYPLDIIYESVIRSLDDVKNPKPQPPSEEAVIVNDSIPANDTKPEPPSDQADKNRTNRDSTDQNQQENT